jgi:putative oxidoreductase
MRTLLSPLGSVDLALLVLRVVFGVCVLKHGWGKLSHIEDLVTIWKVPLPLAWTVTAIQIAGAFAMVLGFLTVPFALALAVVHLVATWKLITMANEPFVAPSRHSWSIGLIYTAMPLVLAIAGPGAYSLDAMLLSGISP